MARMKLYDKQAYPILASLYNTLTGREVTVANYGDYCNVFERLKDFYKTDTDFQNAVYSDIFAKTGKVVWEEKTYAGDPFAFVHRGYEELGKFIKRGYVFDRPCDTDTIPDKYFSMSKTPDDANYDAETLTKYEQMRWRGKEYPTMVKGTTGKADMHDSIIYYRRWIMDALTEPYEFYSMWSAIKSAWVKHWNSWISQWNRVVFMNMLFTTTLSPIGGVTANGTRTVKLLSEYNQKFGKTLNKDTWYKPENIKDFAPWAYIRLNEIKRVMGYDNNQYMTDNKTEFRGKTYEYTYAPKDLASAFLKEPFLLMKAYANAYAFNENDWENVDVHQIDFWENPVDKYKASTASYQKETANGFVLESSETELDDVFGIIYDPDSIGSATYNERHYDTGLNEVTEHGVLHVHANFTNYYNPMLKAVTILLA